MASQANRGETAISGFGRVRSHETAKGSEAAIRCALHQCPLCGQSRPLLRLDCISICLLKDVNDACSGLDESPVLNARWNRVTISGFVDLCLSTDGKFDLAFDNSPPLSAVGMLGEFHILEKSEKGHKAII
jgi:hypothetical protein